MINRFRFLLITLFLALSLTLSAIDWHTWRYGDIRVTAASKDTSYATLVVKRLHQRINAFQMELGVYPLNPLVIKIIPNRKEYKRITRGKSKIVESSEAFYSPGERVIYVRSPEQVHFEVYDNVLMHEYIHWFLDETLTNVPLWFHEGMAMYYSGQFGFQVYYNFSRYRFMGYKLSIKDMVYNYPTERSNWNMFYLTSVFAINFLAHKRNDQWQMFWDRVSFVYNRATTQELRKSNFTQTFYAAFRMSQYTFSKEYDKTLKRYGWQFPLIGFNALIFSLLPLVIIAGWLRSRRRLKAMPDTETPETEETDKQDEIPEEQPLPEESNQPGTNSQDR